LGSATAVKTVSHPRWHLAIPLSAILKRTGGFMCSINGILYHDRGRLVDEAVLERMRAV